MVNEVLIFPLALIASLVGSLVGLGGGFLFIPLAHLLIRLDLRDCIFISLIKLFFLSAIHCLRNKELFRENKKLIGPSIIMAGIGVFLSSYMAQKIPVAMLQNGLGI